VPFGSYLDNLIRLVQKRDNKIQQERRQIVDVQDLRCFLVLTEEMNFTNAAFELHISQSSLSKKIKALEEELNVTLFDRTTKKIKLTQAGRDFAMYASQIMKVHEEMIASISKYSTKKKITLTSAQVLSYYRLTNLIMNYSEKNSNINLLVTEVEPDKVITDLQNKKADLGIIYEEYLDGGEFDSFPLINDKLILVVGRCHPLSAADLVSVAELRNELFLMIRANEFDIKDTISMCAKYNFLPKLSPLNLRLNSMGEYLVRGNCVSVMPKVLAKSLDESEICIIDLEKPIPRTLAIVVPQCKKNKDIDNLVDYILSNYQRK
jgi:LysR family transcriptional activator of glutamate synthase operon